MRLEINPKYPEPRKIARAVECLRAGEVIAYPTDTVYGLGCSSSEKKAIERLYEVKQMASHRPLAFLCPDLSDIARYAVVDNWTYRVLRRALPGPYCFILTATREVPRILMVKRKTIGIRVPDNPVVQALLRELGVPLVSTSATRGDETFNDPADIDRTFHGIALTLDAGIGGLIPSTVVDMSGPEPSVDRMGAGTVEGVL